MKKFLLYQAVDLLVILIMLTVVSILPLPLWFKILFGCFIIYCAAKDCKPILLLPIDLLLGKDGRVEKNIYYSGNFFQKTAYLDGMVFPVWKFYFGQNKILFLTQPLMLKLEDIPSFSNPATDSKIRVTYYRLSKILIHWEEYREKT